MLKKLSSLLFGGSCFLCRGAAQGVLCAACDADLPRLRVTLCPRCALASPGGALCGRCLAEPPDYDATVAALAYAFPADALVHALKFRGELALAPLLAELLLRENPPRSNASICVVPVPLSRAAPAQPRLQPGGRDRARPRAAARRSSCSCASAAATRAAQTELPWAERRRNVRGAFRCARPLAGGTRRGGRRRDDHRARRWTRSRGTLKRAGAARVVNWVVARTYMRNAVADVRHRPGRSRDPAQRRQRRSASRRTPAAACTWSSRSASRWTTSSSSAPGSTTTSWRA